MANDGIYTSTSETIIKDKEFKVLRNDSKILHFSRSFDSKEFSKDKLILKKSNDKLDKMPFEAFWFFKCDVDAVAPGDNCLGQKCPEKSFLGGKTWFCVCTKNCSFCVGTDCNQE